MSLMIAIKENDCVYLAVDLECKENKSHSPIVIDEYRLWGTNCRMWKTKGLENSFIVCQGNVLMWELTVMMIRSLIPESRAASGNIDVDFIKKEMLENIVKALDGFFGADLTNPDSFMNNEFLFVYKDKIFDILGTKFVNEINDYIAIGFNSDKAMEILAQTIGQPVNYRLMRALYAASDSEVRPILITDTNTCEVKEYSREDIKKALNVE